MASPVLHGAPPGFDAFKLQPSALQDLEAEFLVTGGGSKAQ